MQIPAFFGKEDIDLAAFNTLCSQTTRLQDYSFASAVEKNVVIYSGDVFRSVLQDRSKEAALKAELNDCLSKGPGVLVIKNVYPELQVIDATTALFRQIIKDEKESGQTSADHFGTNERIWNSLQKVCERDPELFVAYYGEPVLALISEAWLGPYYQITAQVNNVKPGSAFQSPHRDYHLGFQSDEVVTRFPAQVQIMSQYLTLQGAIAHTDMPLASGPTLFLPYSQQFEAGYQCYRHPDFIAYFEKHHVQLPLAKGDAVYFSPALFHGAGSNQLNTDRLANLVQISSAFGRPMESVNRHKMIDSVYPVLLAANNELDERQIRNTIAAVADGYSFPTNLDLDPPLGGNAPKTTQDIVLEALQGGWPLSRLQQALHAYKNRRQA